MRSSSDLKQLRPKTRQKNYHNRSIMMNIFLILSIIFVTSYLLLSIWDFLDEEDDTALEEQALAELLQRRQEIQEAYLIAQKELFKRRKF